MIQVGLCDTKYVQHRQTVGDISQTLITINKAVFFYYFPQGRCARLSIYKQGLTRKKYIKEMILSSIPQTPHASSQWGAPTSE